MQSTFASTQKANLATNLVLWHPFITASSFQFSCPPIPGLRVFIVPAGVVWVNLEEIFLFKILCIKVNSCLIFVLVFTSDTFHNAMFSIRFF